MRCPECASDRQQIYTRQDITPSPVAALWRDAPVTTVLIGANILFFILQIATGFPLAVFPSSGAAGWVSQHGVFFGPAIAHGDYWRVVTPGFLHLGIIHIALNMYLLYILGRMLEPELGSIQMVAVYFTSLIAGSLGAMILEPGTPSAGASGAIFGLMGMALVVARARQIRDAFQQIGILIVLNLVITFGYSGVSKGAHLGGLIGGALCGLVLFELGEKRGLLGKGSTRHRVGTAVVVVLGLVFYAACILIARNQYPQFVG
jgi:membrane associated rhomboid family serine protease